MNNWYLYCKKADFAAISRQFNISPILARILVNRGIVSADDIHSFLYGGRELMHDPFLMKDMLKGAELALLHINAGSLIRIIGDYDVDGICASYILKSFFQYIGARCDVRLPDRILDGYGMNESMSEEALKDGISLIITCDNGVSSYEAVKLAKDQGIDVIITDHHEIPDVLPPADAVIDAKQEDCRYPFRELCGAAVSYKFIQALGSLFLAEKNEDEKTAYDLESLYERMIQYAGMATITDIVPLKGENHIFARLGIEYLKRTDNPGLLALFKIKGIEADRIKGYHVGFIIGPSINSAGRLKNAKIAFDLLDTKDPEAAVRIAGELNELNEERKALTLEQTKAAELIIEEDPEMSSGKKKVLVIYLKDAHESVAGIIAGKLKEKYNRPVLVITDSEDGLKGSGRSTDDYNMVEALKRHNECFRKFGGHAKAAGFTLRVSPEELSIRLNQDSQTDNISTDKKLWIDMQLPFRYVTEDLTRELAMLEPFGLDNERPVFAEKDVRFLDIRLMGRSMNVLKILMENASGDRIEGVMFSHGQDMTEYTESIRNVIQKLGNRALFQILYFPHINEFRGRKTPQAVLEAIRFPGED